ncbi:MAG: biotin attachment protein [Nitrospirae bacterium]|nr:biotin attachment protein [Nitrospirota bacterium]
MTEHTAQNADKKSQNSVFIKPGMSPREIIKAARSVSGVLLTSTGMRDAGQSDYKNRHRMYDLKTLAPYYNKMGLFSAECHGGARWHVGIMNRREGPFEEIDTLRELMPSEMVDLGGGVDEIILCIKDMAGVGSPERISSLVDAIKQRFPDLTVQYHRHSTDGLAMPALLAAAQAGAKILDVQEDSLTRFYGQAPILGVQAYLEESGITVNIDREQAEAAVQKVRDWIGHYEWAESPFKGYDHTVILHRMPGGAFPSSFEQAANGGFLQLMPAVLKVMSLYNRIIRYFDVTPGSQITWVACSGIVNRYDKERGEAGVRHVIQLLTKFVEEKSQDIDAMDSSEQEELLGLFRNAPGDFKNLLLGGYGRLPMGWPAEWVYKSSFGEEWELKIRERKELSPLDSIEDDDIGKLRQGLSESIGRAPSEEEFILYLMHPKDAIEMINFREIYGEAPLLLPTNVWREGLKKPGDKVEFELWGKPYCVELVSVGAEHEGLVHVVMRVNNKTRVYTVETPRAKKTETRMARGNGDVGAPINGNIWRIGNPERGAIKAGDIVHKGEEIANLEAMKMENAIIALFDGQIAEVCVRLNDTVQEGQLLFVLEKLQVKNQESLEIID